MHLTLFNQPQQGIGNLKNKLHNLHTQFFYGRGAAGDSPQKVYPPICHVYGKHPTVAKHSLTPCPGRTVMCLLQHHIASLTPCPGHTVMCLLQHHITSLTPCPGRTVMCLLQHHTASLTPCAGCTVMCLLQHHIASLTPCPGRTVMCLLQHHIARSEVSH